MSRPRGLLRVFVAGTGPRADAVTAAARAVGRAAPGGPYAVEVVDVLDDLAEARAHGIVLTPTLVRIAPGPERRWVGDLTITDRILADLSDAS